MIQDEIAASDKLMAIASSEGRIDDAKTLRARQEELVKKLQAARRRQEKKQSSRLCCHRRGHRGSSFHVVQSSCKQTH